ncbi:cation diffusion facilitator family transporter [Actinocorallia populi]|uniref:cation diffusion facilitator family transporter n=1 Tax=Actinocorallia populi TaxID=2079200 RepID=UPI000D0975EE|nr:cation diffusion facilitator family transporter [Actinocorallia populi]
MGTGHGHGHGLGRRRRHGEHGEEVPADRGHLVAALALIAGFMVVEVAAGLASGSLALLTDAAHLLTDAVAIALALVAMRLAAAPPRGGYTYGLKRAEILSAQLNGLTLVLLALSFAYEGARRLLDPPEVQGGVVLGTALAGVAVNLAATWLMSRADRSSLNVEGAYQHVLNDLLAFLATAAAGGVVLFTGWHRADAVASLVVAVLMVKAGWGLVRDAGRVLMEAAPAGMDPAEIGGAMAGRPRVLEVHDLHVWEVTSGYPALSAHVLVDPDGDCRTVRRDLRRVLRERYEITHTTLEVEHTREEGPHCGEAHGPRHVMARVVAPRPAVP